MTIALLILTLLSSGHSTIQETEVLTSKKWLEYGDNLNNKVIHVFRKNGEYITKSGDISFTGRWYWTDNNEIFTLINEFKNDTVSYQFSEGLGSLSPGSYIRITQLNDKELKTLERHEGDSWDSGFAKERTYLAQDL